MGIRLMFLVFVLFALLFPFGASANGLEVVDKEALVPLSMVDGDGDLAGMVSIGATRFEMGESAEVMLAETSSGLWTMWNPAERQEHVQDLVRQAGQKGFSSLWLTDEIGRPLALWEQGSDPKLF